MQTTMRTIISDTHDIDAIDEWCEQHQVPAFQLLWLDGAVVGWVADLSEDDHFLTRLRWS